MSKLTDEQKEHLEKHNRVMTAMNDLYKSDMKQFEKEKEIWIITQGEAWGLKRDDYDSLKSFLLDTCVKMAETFELLDDDD